MQLFLALAKIQNKLVNAYNIQMHIRLFTQHNTTLAT